MSKHGKCPHCGRDDWEETPLFRTINPNGEYVNGYGCVPVQIQSGNEYHCRGCRYRLGDAIKKGVPNPYIAEA